MQTVSRIKTQTDSNLSSSRAQAAGKRACDAAVATRDGRAEDGGILEEELVDDHDREVAAHEERHKDEDGVVDEGLYQKGHAPAGDDGAPS